MDLNRTGIPAPGRREQRIVPFAYLLAFALALVQPVAALANGPAPTQAQSRYEVFFMEEMIDHHAMAVQMATMCEQRAVHPELLSLCTSIKTSQSQGLPKCSPGCSSGTASPISPR